MGEVYRAEDLKLGQTIALKFLPRAWYRDPSRIARFRNEVRLAREITHPNVCRVYDIGESDGRHFLSMEYVDGEDLASLLRRIGRLPVEKAVEVAREICAGLAAAHGRGVLHRDLKPANIMIDGRGDAHITDFGLAITIEDRLIDEVAGTPAYMAPEQIAGGLVSEQTDLFSLGLILYELFTGVRVFRAESVQERSQTKESADSIVSSAKAHTIEGSIAALIVECVQSDPVKRPASADAVASRLPGGGDPLAAAVAAGQVPSPAMVEAAGETRGLQPLAAWICCATALTGLVLLATHIKTMTVYGQAPLTKPPDALVDRAQQLIVKMGYTESSIDSAYWFAIGRASGDLASTRSGGYEFAGRSTGVDGDEVVFVYRQSPEYLVSENTYGVVTYREPPANVPGMADVVLDRLGRLIRFTGVPDPSAPPSQTSQPFGSVEAFAAAGIDSSRLKPIEPAWTPPVKYDAVTAWEGVHPDRPSEPVDVTAASWGGRLVLFDTGRLGFPAPPTVQRTSAGPVAEFTLLALTLAALIGSGILARRNIRQGRWDRSGALKVGTYVFALGLSWEILRANHVALMLQEYLLFSKLAGLSLYYAGSLFLCYAAFEPLVRQRWPLVLTSWTRVLSGRFRDSLVGRDILIGALIGVAVMLLRESEFVILRVAGLTPAFRFNTPLDGLGSVREFVSLALFAHLFAVQLALGGLLIVLLLRMICRSDGAAIIVSVIVMAPLTTLPGNHLALEILLGALVAALTLFGLLRFGLLALIVEMSFTSALTFLPISLDRADWYRGRSALLLIGLGAITAYGTYFAQERSAAAGEN
jgi:serine/threonine-protein kinase